MSNVYLFYVYHGQLHTNIFLMKKKISFSRDLNQLLSGMEVGECMSGRGWLDGKPCYRS